MELSEEDLICQIDKKFYYVYLITNNINNKKYVGSRMAYKKEDIHNDSYMGSSKYLNEDYIIYGKENFSKEILQNDYLNLKEMLKGESYYMHMYNTLTPSGYNRYDPMKNPGFHMGGCHHSEETKRKQSNTRKKLLNSGKIKIIISEETKNKLKNSNKGKLLGKSLSSEHKNKLSESKKGKTWEQIFGIEEATKRRLKLKERLKSNHPLKGKKGTRKGAILSSETKEKMKKSALGRKMSEEAKKKMSESKKGKIPWNKGLKINNI